MAKIEESFNKCPLCGAALEPVVDRNNGTVDCSKCRSSLWFRSKDRSGTYFRVLEKPGKNSRCPCGSGHAYVRCCGRRAK